MEINESTQLAVRLKFEAHGDRSSTFAAAMSFFSSNFKEDNWRLVYVEEELDTGMHEDLERIEDNSSWDVRYDAVGVLR